MSVVCSTIRYLMSKHKNLLRIWLWIKKFKIRVRNFALKALLWLMKWKRPLIISSIVLPLIAVIWRFNLLPEAWRFLNDAGIIGWIIYMAFEYKIGTKSPLLNKSKIEITLTRHTYSKSYDCHHMWFTIINHNERPTQYSELLVAVKGIKNQARMPWYWRGIDDKGNPYDKTVEQMHLKNESPHTALLPIRVKQKIGTVGNLGDFVLTDTSPLLAPLGRFDLKISVVGLNHGRRDELFTIEVLDQERIRVEKSRSSF